MMARKAYFTVTGVTPLYKNDIRLALQEHATLNKIVDHDASLYRFAWAAFRTVIAAPPVPHNRPFDHVKRQANSSSTGNLQVDLGYEIYEGAPNGTSGINYWKGIRFAAPPLGEYRWQAPQPPAINRQRVLSAKEYGPVCPQSGTGGSPPPATYGSEDCLVLNVWAPDGAVDLPVLVWIHGGGYGEGSSQQDLSYIIEENGNNFVGVAIQYRLGAFGFLSSDEVFRNGVVNAGILDQTFALKWVQTYIHLFGGDSSRVTISGESAGGGSVMLQTMAYGGSLGTTLFENAFASSPYLPEQYGYADWVPSQSYYAFANYVGCFQGTAYGFETKPQTIFECLISKDTHTLQNASFYISSTANYGVWGFLPVTDGVFIQDRPSKQLAEKRVNGLRMLTGNNADEGYYFVPQNITTEQDLLSWLELTFPLFSTSDLAKVLLYYPARNVSVNPDAELYATDGLTKHPDAVTESPFSTGQQQRANDIYAETTFVCPSYWLAEAFSNPPRASYKYQYSIIPALHGQDVSAYFGPYSEVPPYQGPEFVKAFAHIVGNFVVRDNPSISAVLANGNATAAGMNPATNWPEFDIYAPYQIDLNQTGGREIEYDATGSGTDTRIYVGRGLENDFTAVNAYTWEGGRGYRCDFWKSVGVLVPE